MSSRRAFGICSYKSVKIETICSQINGANPITTEKTTSIEIAIEKGFQPGGKEIRDMGINLKSLAIIDSVENGQAVFRS